MPDTRFKMPLKPKNGLDLLRWVFFEPVLLQKFSGRLTKKESFFWFLRAYPWIAFFCCLIWIVSIFTVAVLDIPSHFPEEFGADFIEQWQHHPTILSKIDFLLTSDSVGANFGLGIGLGLGFVSGAVLFFADLHDRLLFGLLFGSSSIGIGLFFCFVFGFTVWVGIVGGFFLGGYCSISRYAGIISGLSLGFLFGFGAPHLSPLLSTGLTFGLAFVATFWIMCFRIIFYPVHILRSRSLLTFEQNPYLRDGTIWLPIWPVNRKLLLLAKQQPEIAIDFANFLLEYRPLQKKLAMRILQAVRKGESENMNSHRDSETQSEESELK